MDIFIETVALDIIMRVKSGDKLSQWIGRILIDAGMPNYDTSMFQLGLEVGDGVEPLDLNRTFSEQGIKKHDTLVLFVNAWNI